MNNMDDGRRAFLAVAAGLLVAPRAGAQSPRQIRDMRGEVMINGRPAQFASLIGPGDTLSTGSDGWLTFVHGSDAFFLRARTQMRLETGMPGGVIGTLRLLTGALAGVFGKGGPRVIHAPNVTAGIRGTGVYLETRPEGTYTCACFGTVDLASTANSRDRAIVEAKQHHAHLVLNQPRDDSRLQTAPFENHTDEEIDGLERLVGRRAPWVRR
jgi:hypothetical protein